MSIASVSPKPQGCAIVTGGNTGLGFACAKQIASSRKDWQVIIACRNLPKAHEAVQSLIRQSGNPNVSAMHLDLASLHSVRLFVEEIQKGELPPVAAIVCNAGMSRVDEPLRTADGIEMTFGVNFLGHFLLVNSLISMLPEDAKIALVSSELHRENGSMKSFLPRYTTAKELAFPPKSEEEVPHIASRRYATSKLCLILYARQLAQRLASNGRGITVLAFNPGLMPDTGLGGLNKHAVRRFFLKHILPIFARGAVSNPERSGKMLADLVTGLQTTVFSGAYYDQGRQVEPSAMARDTKLQLDLWQTSLEITGLDPDFPG
ncbi:MAG: SDR family NAD(P)-dependent oxidoreductase [Bacteroidia bacterium]|nr:SDR family NAD(P)-dependent oxidoreductase [Bacteroidia bacterium]